MFLSGSLNPNSLAVGVGAKKQEAALFHCSCSTIKKLNGLKRASQSEFFYTVTPLNLSDGDEHRNWMLLFTEHPPFRPHGLAATPWTSGVTWAAWHVTQVILASSLPHSPSLGSAPWEWLDRVGCAITTRPFCTVC